MLTKIFAALAIFGMGLSALASPAHAQSATPSLVISWSALGYVPAAYKGKILPTFGSPISATLTAMNQGKLGDLSRETINWYENNIFIGGGVGKVSINFKGPTATTPTTISLRAQIANYKNTGAFLAKTVQISIVAPHVAIVAPLPYHRFSSNQIGLFAMPYFFNISNTSTLNISWRINGKEATKGSGADDALDLTMLAGTAPGYIVIVDASGKSIETTPGTSGVGTISLIYQ